MAAYRENGKMSAPAEKKIFETVGTTAPVPPKVCRECARRGEWPGQPCPACRSKVTSAPEVVVAQQPTAPERELEELAQVVNDEYGRVLVKGREMIEHAIRCGEALLKARESVEPGMWLYWFEHNIDTCSIWTAHRFMRVARHAEEVRGSGAQSIEAAMRLLADKPRHGQGPCAYSEADKAQMVELANQVGFKTAAKSLGVSVSTVWKWAAFNSPSRVGAERSSDDRLGSAITDEAIEQLALWLCDRFGGETYPVRVTDEVRDDALAALQRIVPFAGVGR